MTQRQLRRANQQQQQHVDSTAIIVFFFKAAARPDMCAPSVAPIAHRLHCQISIIIQAVLYIAHFAQQSWEAGTDIACFLPIAMRRTAKTIYTTAGWLAVTTSSAASCVKPHVHRFSQSTYWQITKVGIGAQTADLKREWESRDVWVAGGYITQTTTFIVLLENGEADNSS